MSVSNIVTYLPKHSLHRVNIVLQLTSSILVTIENQRDLNYSILIYQLSQAAYCVSLGTNVLGTCCIVYKAW